MQLLIKIFALYGLCCFIGLLVFLVVFGPRIYRFFRIEHPGFFNWSVLGRRFQHWSRRNAQVIQGYLFILGVVIILLLSLIVTHPL